MKVSELIEQLKAMPQNLEVIMYADWSAPIRDIHVETGMAGKRVILDETADKSVQMSQSART